jgi:hypothetical protein
MTPADTLTTTPDTGLLTCEACERTADPDAFRAFEADEIDDCVCDECLAVQRDAAQWDAYNAAAYYYR